VGIPPLDSHGLLPPGIWDCSWRELEARFAWSAERKALLEGFQRFLSEVWDRLDLVAERPPFLMDGSFVQCQPDPPKDLDVIADLRHVPVEPPKLVAAGLVLRVLRPVTVAVYSVDAWVFGEGLPVNLLHDFQRLGAVAAPHFQLSDGTHKGILRLLPDDIIGPPLYDFMEFGGF
jgi:hypothetical protein